MGILLVARKICVVVRIVERRLLACTDNESVEVKKSHCFDGLLLCAMPIFYPECLINIAYFLLIYVALLKQDTEDFFARVIAIE